MSSRIFQGLPPEAALTDAGRLLGELGAVAWDADGATGDLRSVSGPVEALLGVPAAAWLAPGFWAAHLHPDDRETTLAARREAVAARRDHVLEYRLQAPGSQLVWVRDAARVSVDAQGVVQLRGLLLDISAQKRAERALRRASQDLEHAHRLARIGSFTHDLDSGHLGLSTNATVTAGGVLMGGSTFDSFLKNVHPDDADGLAARLRAAFESDAPSFSVEYRLLMPSGEVAHLRALGQIVRNAEGRAVRVFGTVQNITEQRAAEAEIQAHVRFLESLDAVNQAIQRASEPDAMMRTVLDTLLRQFCADRAFLARRTAAEPPKWQIAAERTRPEFPGAGERHVLVGFESIFERSRGSGTAILIGQGLGPNVSDEARTGFNVRSAVAIALEPAGHAPFVLGLHYCRSDAPWTPSNERLLQEIGRRLSDALTVAFTHEALQQSEQRLAEAQRITNLGYWERDFERQRLYASEETANILGASAEERALYDLAECERRWRERLHPDDRAEVMRASQQSLATGQPYIAEYRIVRPDGEVRYVRSMGDLTTDASGRPVRWFGTLQDITARRRAEQAATDSLALMRAIVQGTTDAIYVKDLQGRYLMVNRAFADLHDKTIDEIIGSSGAVPGRGAGLTDDELSVLATGEARTFEATELVNGAPRYFHAATFAYSDASGAPVGLVGVWRDMTALKQLEGELRQSQKMEAVGRLAGGVAHNFNNLLTVILGYADVLSAHMEPSAPNRDAVDQIARGAERAAAMTRQLLTFSRTQALSPQVVNLASALTELHTLLRPLIPEDIEMSVHADADLGAVLMDPGEFEQAMTNLVVNASDAMPGGGRLRIEAINTTIEADDTPTLVPPGDYVDVRVWDSGHGMDASTRARIFEPFFTTKPLGKGTGLGLSMVYGFVSHTSGHIDVTSTPGSGTLFRMLLPRAAATPPPPDASRATPQPARGSETILLVEDEDAVRRVAKLVLESRGYRVIEAHDGAHGLEVARAHQGRIDLLLTDLVMPKMNGRQLADALSAEMPHLRVLLMSGYPDKVAPAGVTTDPRMDFMSKPFQPSVLTRRVRESLDRASAGA